MSALAAGVCRSTQVQFKRMQALRLRVGWFRKLRAMQVDTAKLLRTGGNIAINYDAAITTDDVALSSGSCGPQLRPKLLCHAGAVGLNTIALCLA